MNSNYHAIYHLPTTGGDVFTAPCGVVELTCEELGAVSPSVTGITCHMIPLIGLL